MTTYESGPLDTVACEPAGARWTLVLTRGVDHTPERVWSMLSSPEQLEAWAPYAAGAPLDRTGPVSLHTHGDDEPTPSHVLTVEPPRLLEHSWGTDVLRWELTPTEHGSRLRLTHTLDERSSVPSVAAGWHLCLNALVASLDGAPIGPVHGEHARRFGWDALRERYAELLGSYQSPG